VDFFLQHFKNYQHADNDFSLSKTKLVYQELTISL